MSSWKVSLIKVKSEGCPVTCHGHTTDGGGKSMLHSSHFIPNRTPPVSIVKKVGWDKVPVWTPTTRVKTPN
jgi:hypothetical protein